MKFTDAIKSGFNNYVGFSGRARRSEYWYWVLFVFIVTAILSLLGGGDADGLFGILTTLFGIAVFLPGLAMAIRRLHDTNRSGWFVLLAFIPLVGFIILLVFYVQEGTTGENRFGADPKA